MKSYVSMEQKVFEVCGHLYDTNSILIDRRLKESMESYTVTGRGMCPKDQDLSDKGYIALVEISNKQYKENIKQEEAERTGRVAHLKREVARKIFPSLRDGLNMVFMDSEVMNHLEKLQSTANA